jgi:PST family polysaccharide transporter
VKVVLNKAVAVFLGPQGMGIIGLFYSAIEILKSFCGLGIAQSAVRDISEANNSNDRQSFSKALISTKRLILITGIFGAIVTVLSAYFLSLWSFKTDKYFFSFVLLSVAVFIMILNEGQLAIIKGMRLLKSLAKATIFSSLISLLIGIPMYYFIGEKGIVPVFIITGLASLAFSWTIVNKIKFEKVRLTLKEVLAGSREMIKLGLALTYIIFLGLLSNYVLRIYIAEFGSFAQVGIFQAGSVIITSYFAIILLALNTDFYPRMFAVAKDNLRLKEEIDVQLKSSFILITPIFVFLFFALPYLIRILYTSDFLSIVPYLRYAMFGIIINLYADTMGVILIAKQQSKLFSIYSSFYRVISLPILIFGYKFMGFEGLGIATVITGLFSLVALQIIIKKQHNIAYSRSSNLFVVVCVAFCVCTVLVTGIENELFRNLLGILILLINLFYSNNKLKEFLGLNVFMFMLKKLNITKT